MQTQLLHGTVVTVRDGRVRSAVDRYGNEVWAARWQGEQLHAVRLRRPDRTEVVLQATTESHPLFHRAHAVQWNEATVARCGQTTWADPQAIPPVDTPAAMPPGAGSALLNWLAGAAVRAGASSLRYRGPYPTAALFDSLLQSFTVEDPATALERFTKDVESRSVRGAMTEVDVPFTPAPFEWHWPNPRTCIQLRGGLERAYIDGRGYSLHQMGTRRLRRDGDASVAYIDLGGIAWHDVLHFAADGTPVGEPVPVPTAPPGLVGQALPEEIVALLSTILQQRAPRMLVATVSAVLSSRVLRWGDTGDELARPVVDAIELHSAFGEQLPQMDPQRMLAAFVFALEPVVNRLAQAELAAGTP